MKKFFIMIFGFIIFISSTCSASISSNRFFLGGLTLEKNISEATSMYGAASRTEKNGNLTFHYYGDGSFFIAELSNRIVGIYTNDNNEIATPDGLTVGMAEQVISDVYGKADSIIKQEDGLTNYIYYKSGRGGNYEELKFFVREGKIKGISLRYNI